MKLPFEFPIPKKTKKTKRLKFLCKGAWADPVLDILVGMGFTGRQGNQPLFCPPNPSCPRRESLCPSVRHLQRSKSTVQMHRPPPQFPSPSSSPDLCGYFTRSHLHPQLPFRFPLSLRLSHSPISLVEIASSFRSLRAMAALTMASSHW